MNKLIYANLNRFRKGKAFLIALVAMVCYGLLLCIGLKYSMSVNNIVIEFQEVYISGFGFNGIVAVPGVIMSVFCSVFIGTEFSDGTIRNKLIVGHTRLEVYFANFISCVIAGMLLLLTYIIVVMVIAIPICGFFTVPVSIILKLTFTGVMMIISYAAIFNFVSMLVQNKTTSVIINLLGVMLFMFVVITLISKIQEPKLIEVMEITNGQQVYKKIENTRYLSKTARTICQFIVDFLPTGQSLQLSGMSVINLHILPIYSTIIIILTNMVGIFTFQHKDLK